MALTLNGAILQRTYVVPSLGGGSRTLTATITSTRNSENEVTTTITIGALPNMSEAELTAYQTNVNLLDEEAVLTDALVVLDDATP